MLAGLAEVVQLPIAFYQGVTLERRYELSTQSVQAWWYQRVKANGVGLVVAAGGALVICSLLRWNPRDWWVISAVFFASALVALAQLAPVTLLPLFYTFTPLNRPALTERLVALAARTRTPVLGVFEWRLGDRTRKANAALAGIGRTRRILLSDTLLAEHSDDEIEVILAHELAHHVHYDIWKAVALESALVALGFYVADYALTAVVGRYGVVAKDDIAALPVLALTVGGVSVALLPLANALSRRHERRADRYALDLTGNAAAFLSAMKRLALQNLAEEQPSRLVELLFYSHPPTGARLETARVWAADKGIRIISGDGRGAGPASRHDRRS
jgi:STE24 endopeptidase